MGNAVMIIITSTMSHNSLLLLSKFLQGLFKSVSGVSGLGSLTAAAGVWADCKTVSGG